MFIAGVVGFLEISTCTPTDEGTARLVEQGDAQPQPARNRSRTETEEALATEGT